MALRWRLLLSLAVIASPLAGIAIYSQRETLYAQWQSFQVGKAESYEAAQSRLAWFQQGPHAVERTRELAAAWGTGNPRFDLYLARYVHDQQSTETLRQAFSLELAWRDGLLARWARYWSWHVKLAPSRQIALLTDYFRLLTRREPPPPISWREVLDLQAMFELTGQQRLALRLSPENWRERFERWQQSVRPPFPDVKRPESPFADWQDASQTPEGVH